MNTLNAYHFIIKDLCTLIAAFDSKEHNYHIYTHT